MATYTPQQLKGSGSLGEGLNGLKTFTFNNPSGSSYFVIETLRNTNGYYDSTTPTNCEGAYLVSSSMTLVTSSYISSVVVPTGVSSFKYTPDSAVTGTDYYLRGVGDYTLTIS
tara:strand:+ start:2231 stop:2569 length:339 start_codon:yes stop_codon:yes gene_type:complete